MNKPGKTRVLIVEDEPDIAGLMKHALERGADLAVEIVATGAAALKSVHEEPPGLILLDLNLPFIDGLEVCRLLRARPASAAIPIIMVTARTSEAERVAGLELGADDYVTKPFSLRELRARVRAQLRRGTRQAARVCQFGDCEVDFTRAELRRSGQPVDITPLELRLLGVFLDNRDRLLTRDQLISAAWGHGTAITDRAVDTHVFNLRKKIEPQPASPTFLVSVRGLGYRFESQS